MVSAYTVLILQSFFAKIPRSLEEAALMDGATEFTIFRTVYLPLSKAGIATVTLFQFVGKWNNFMESVIFLNDPSKYTLQVALKNLIISSDITSTTDSVSKNTQMAGVVITIIPLIIVYVFLQRYFITGLTAGAVKE
jgi:putative aldouronate transport system permease protein